MSQFTYCKYHGVWAFEETVRNRQNGRAIKKFEKLVTILIVSQPPYLKLETLENIEKKASYIKKKKTVWQRNVGWKFWGNLGTLVDIAEK